MDYVGAPAGTLRDAVSQQPAAAVGGVVFWLGYINLTLLVFNLLPAGARLRRRNQLREQFEIAKLEDLAASELELLDRALARHALLVASDDERIAFRACKEIFDRTLGRPAEREERGGSAQFGSAADVAGARERLAALIERHALDRA